VSRPRDILTRHHPGSVAILDPDEGTETTYGQLLERVTRTAEHLRRELGRALVFHLATNTTDSIVLYLACLEAGCPVALLEAGSAHRWEPLLRAYEPDAIFVAPGVAVPAGVRSSRSLPDGVYRMVSAAADRRLRTMHPQLALLLTTSGSTGSPKLVRLTRNNVFANARSIVSYLGVQPGDRSIQSLPMHYSYGLSLVNSHLVAGATVVLTRHSFMRPEFWDVVDQSACTSFAGVPYMYETLDRLRFDPGRHRNLHTMTQAGGGLRHDLIRSFDERCRAVECRFFVMYGQTEATARISYVPVERLPVKIGSIGIPIPMGSLSLASLDESDHQELIYSGPNVMMGYADSPEHLAAGDELRGTLRTGDLARVDDEGFFYLTGRLGRFAKLFGRRISLEDIEKELEFRYPIAAAASDCQGQLLIHAAARERIDLDGMGRYLAQQLGVPPRYIRIDAVDRIPLTASGKKDYKALSS